jgi:CheY-like chemotaxis protein
MQIGAGILAGSGEVGGEGYSIPYLGGRQREPISGREPELSGLRQSIDPLIVLVDDEPSLTELIKLIFNLAGYNSLVSFPCGEGVLDYCRANHPSLLITDIYHPGPNGLELCRMIREDPLLVDMPVIVCSAIPSQFLGPLEEQKIAYFPKPCNLRELVKYIEETVGLDMRRLSAVLSTGG